VKGSARRCPERNADVAAHVVADGSVPAGLKRLLSVDAHGVVDDRVVAIQTRLLRAQLRPWRQTPAPQVPLEAVPLYIAKIPTTFPIIGCPR
jgi:hypothetical protein